ncbi:VirB2 family type IV secretion system major pilin TrwL [Bartonella sp. TT121SHDZB]|uniref:VirB2 family type IV secretion system major pilin TrwL n=1 Tax=Bartonella sp. TT121SHDZB TaxID=3243580 RepID=UPI0035CF7303
MKQISNLYSKTKNGITVISTVISTFFIMHPVYAQKLDTAKKALETLKDDLTGKIIPVAATVILLCLAIGYAGRYIEKETFIRWAIGVIIAGSATQLAQLLLNG